MELQVVTWTDYKIAREKMVQEQLVDRGIADKRVIAAMLQIPKSRDEADLEFMLRTNTGIQYPPIVVETPIFIREVISPFDANAPVSAIYQYVAHFPVRGGPGVPPIGPRVSALSLEVIDGDCTGSARFDLRSP